jgi:hypothetical protein
MHIEVQKKCKKRPKTRYGLIIYRKLAHPLLPLFGRLGSLDLLGTAELLRTVFALLPQLARRLLNLGGESGPHETVLGLEFLLRLFAIIDQSETGAASTTKLCAKTEGHDTVFIRLVKSSELLLEFSSRNIGTVRVKDVNDELTTGEEAVSDKFTGAEGDRC